MKLGLAYECHYNRNVGRIKAIDGDKLIASINAGHGGGDVELPISCCVGFTPNPDDRVLLCVDEDGERPGYLLQKLSKNRRN